MSFTLFSFAMLLICVLCIGKEVFKGFKGGLFLSFISLCAIISSIICGILFARIASRYITAVAMRGIRYEIFNGSQYVGDSAAIDNVAKFFVQAIINSIIFVILFLIFKLLINAVLKLVLNRKVKREGRAVEAETKKDRVGGIILGLFCGILVASAVTAPIMGTLHIIRDATGVIDVLDDDVLSSANFERSTLDEINKYASDIPGNFCYSLGGRLIYNQIAVGDFNAKTVSAVNEVKQLTRGIESVLQIVGRLSEDNIDLSVKIDVSVLNDVIDNSEIIKTVVAEGISEFSASWLRGESFIGISRPDFNDNLEPLVDELLTVCAGTNVYNVKDTVSTLVDIFGVLVECGISADSTSEDIDYHLLIVKLVEVLDKNPRMQTIKEALFELATNAFSDIVLENMPSYELEKALDLIAEEATRAYNIDSADISAKMDELKNGLSGLLENYGIPENDAVIDLLTERLIFEAEMNGGTLDANTIAKIMGINNDKVID